MAFKKREDVVYFVVDPSEFSGPAAKLHSAMLAAQATAKKAKEAFEAEAKKYADKIEKLVKNKDADELPTVLKPLAGCEYFGYARNFGKDNLMFVPAGTADRKPASSGNKKAFRLSDLS